MSIQKNRKRMGSWAIRSGPRARRYAICVTKMTFQQEFPISTSGSCIVRFSCPRHNEFATRAGPGYQDLARRKGQLLKWEFFDSNRQASHVFSSEMLTVRRLVASSRGIQRSSLTVEGKPPCIPFCIPPIDTIGWMSRMFFIKAHTSVQPTGVEGRERTAPTFLGFGRCP
jgi:hypothetical protein